MKHPLLCRELAVLAILLVGPVSRFTGYAQTQQPSTDSVAIAQNWVSLLDAHDFDGAVVVLDNDAYLILDTSVSGEDINNYQGKDQIRQALEQYAQDDTRTRITAGPEDVNGTTAWTETQSSTLWTALGVDSVDVMADAIIETGRIKSIIYELTAESAA